MIDLLLVALFARGHCLFVGVPGPAKTLLLISTLSELLTLQFSRIQFTPDLMPSDITGSEILKKIHDRPPLLPLHPRPDLREHRPRRRDQSHAAQDTGSALQSMQEGRVTAGGQTHPLDPPFLVFATQNPIEQEGTYRCPKPSWTASCWVDVAYPSMEEEVEIVKRGTSALRPVLQKVLSPERILVAAGAGAARASGRSRRALRREPRACHATDQARRSAS